MKRVLTKFGALLLLGCLATPGLATAAERGLSPAVSGVRDRWAEVAYNVPKAQREHAYEQLAKQAGEALKAMPDDPAALIWEGIVLSSLAGEKGGLGALGLVKQARKDFEKSLKLDPNALSGSAYTSLGALYYQVPGWPIGFGDDAKAGELLKQGLRVNPNGIDSNYFYADYLRDQKDWAGAEAALRKALAAPQRPGRELADRGRRGEVEAMLKQVQQQLASR